MDFFWGRIKDIAHSGMVASLHDLYRRIAAAVAAIWNFVFDVCMTVSDPDIKFH
jgi:hypothetical protein